MKSEICSCEGLNVKCKDCLGTGYVTVEHSKKMVKPSDKKNKKGSKLKPLNAEQVGLLTKAEVENLAVTIIGELDLRSKKQMQILNAIPFNTNTFRMEFGAKFEELEALENQKQHLRNQLLVVDQVIILKNYKSNFTFKHFLSDKDIDVKSNRQLKELIRSYKRLKATIKK